MKNNDKKRFLNNKYNRYSIITIEVAMLLTMVLFACILFQSGTLSGTESTTMYVLQNQMTDATTDLYSTPNYLLQSGVETSLSGASVQGDNIVGAITTGVVPQNNSSQQGNVVIGDASTWSTAQILFKASEAINKTKGYTNSLSVHHIETFKATVTECTGGNIVQSVANAMVGWVVEPVDETLSFSGGIATNSEGETVPILLPKRGSFSLQQSGVTGASAKTVNGEYIININLVQESVGMTQVPQHNAAGIGYLDVSSFDLSFLTVDSADIMYKGSSIELHINQQGYVTYAFYRVPLTIKGSGHSGAISGAVTFDGEQTEQWTFVY